MLYIYRICNGVTCIRVTESKDATLSQRLPGNWSKPTAAHIVQTKTKKKVEMQKVERHFGIAGPWTCVLEPEMLDSGPRFLEIGPKTLKFLCDFGPNPAFPGLK